MAASVESRVDAFAAWLEGHGAPAEVAAFNRSVVTGLVLLAGRGPVDDGHVAQAAALAADGAADVVQVERLGALLVRFEAGPVAAAPAPVDGAARAGFEVPAFEAALFEAAPFEIAAVADAAVADVAAAVADVAAGVADVVADAAVEAAPEAVAVAPPGDVAPGDLAGPATPPVPAPSARIAVFVVGGLVLALAVAGAILGRGDEPPPAKAAAAGPVPTAVQRLRRVPLAARFPAGWREASELELGPDAAPGAPSSIVFRGATPSDPDDGVYLAMLPVDPAVVADGDALVEAARTAERGLVDRLAADAATYQPSGCTVVDVDGRPAGACRGVAIRRSERVSLQTYVRVVGDRQVVAMFLARASVPDPRGEAARVVASFTP
jgi:hypothetical protein